MSSKSILTTVVSLCVFLSSTAFAQSKSAVQFYDTTGATKTGKVGWTGDATTGYMFLQTPQDGMVLKTQPGVGVTVSGTVTAAKFTGDGSTLTNLPAPAAPTVGSVTGLQDSLNKKANSADVATLVGAKADTTMLKKKADTTWVLSKIGASGGGTITGVTAGSGLSGGGNTGTVTVAVAAGGIDSSKIATGAITDAKISSAAAIAYSKISGVPTSLPPSGAAGGALSGTYPNPSVAASSVTGLPDSLRKKADTTWVKTQISASTVPASLDTLNVHGTVIQKNGYVGVGITSPSKLLSVDGIAANYVAEINNLSSATSSNGLQLTSGASDNNSTVLFAQGNRVYASGRAYLVGNVGIGTMSPGALLHVYGATGAGIFESSGDTRNNVIIKNTNNQCYVGVEGNTGGGIATNSIANSSILSSNSNYPLHLAVNSIVAMTILGSGNVGIGTTNPISLFTVAGTSTQLQTIQGDNTGTTSMALDNLDVASGGTHHQWIFNNVNSSDRFDLSYYLSGSGSNGPRLSVLPNGTVGIGTITPQYTLDVNGTARCTNGVWATSDRRYKTDITPIDSSLLKVSKLQGVYYTWDRAKWPKKNFPEGKQVGLIAQEVEKVVPEVVNTDKEGYKSLSYDKLTAVLINAMKELEKKVTVQDSIILAQNNRITILEKNNKK